MIPTVNIITRLNIGGPARHVTLLAQNLPSFGFRPVVLAGNPEESEGESQIEGFPFKRIPTLGRPISPLSDTLAFKGILESLNSIKPLLVHTHLSKAGTLGRLAAKVKSVPVVVHTFHGHVLRGYFKHSLTHFFLQVERQMARFADALIAISPTTRDELLSLGIGREEQWRVIPLGLDLHPFMNLPVRESAAKHFGLNLSGVGPIIGIVGRLAPIKDVFTFLDAAQLISKQEPNSIFIVAGDGPQREILKSRASHLLGERIIFLGWVSELRELFGLLDVVVNTSLNEGTPAALIEAGAAGLPIVATDVGGTKTVVVHGKTGLLTEPRDPTQIANCVLRLLYNGEFAQEIGQNAQLWVQNQFSQERLVTNVADLYRELLSRKGIVDPKSSDGF